MCRIAAGKPKVVSVLGCEPAMSLRVHRVVERLQKEGLFHGKRGGESHGYPGKDEASAVALKSCALCVQ